MLETIRLHFGPSPRAAPLEFKPGGITVLVGPNGSGKSLALREIESAMIGAGTRLIVDTLTATALSEEEANAVIEFAKDPTFSDPEGRLRFRSSPLSDRAGSRDAGPTLKRSEILEVLTGVPSPKREAQALALSSALTLRLDGEARLTMLSEQPLDDRRNPARGMLTRLLRSWETRNRIRDHTKDAFDSFFVLDVIGGPNIRVRMATREPVDEAEEASHTDRTLTFLKDAPLITELGDGVRAFTGLVTAVLSSEYRVLLIDEPEAFLHPPLVRDLGRILGQLAAERRGNVIVGTHSADFIAGALQSAASVNIVRLTYDGATATARQLPNATLRPMLRRPMLRSAGVLNSLFHQAVVLTEADPDRVLYGEVNERLRMAGRVYVRDALFLNTNGNAELAIVARPLRDIGVPAAIVADLDSLSRLPELLSAAKVDVATSGAVSALAINVQADFEALDATKTALENMKAGGITRLLGASRFRALRLLTMLARYGVFLVPYGELERWLSGIGPQHPFTKARWIRETLQAMGDDPAAPGYVSAGDNDVWRFLGHVALWANNAGRLGVG